MKYYELLPCPFCGKLDTLTFRSKGFNQPVSVICSSRNGGCGSASGLFDTKQEAADAWNRRNDYDY